MVDKLGFVRVDHWARWMVEMMVVLLVERTVALLAAKMAWPKVDVRVGA